MLVREFTIQQALSVWDATFAYHRLHTPTSKKFEMLDYLCVAMILSISQESNRRYNLKNLYNLVLDIDNGGMILGKLLKYPPTENIFKLIKKCQSEVLSRISFY